MFPLIFKVCVRIKFPLSNFLPALVCIWNDINEIRAKTFSEGTFTCTQSFLVCAHLVTCVCMHSLEGTLVTGGAINTIMKIFSWLGMTLANTHRLPCHQTFWPETSSPVVAASSACDCACWQHSAVPEWREEISQDAHRLSLKTHDQTSR